MNEDDLLNEFTGNYMPSKSPLLYLRAIKGYFHANYKDGTLFVFCDSKECSEEDNAEISRLWTEFYQSKILSQDK